MVIQNALHRRSMVLRDPGRRGYQPEPLFYAVLGDRYNTAQAVRWAESPFRYAARSTDRASGKAKRFGFIYENATTASWYEQISTSQESSRITQAADFIRQNSTRSLRLEEICAEASLSASHLIRAFKQEYGLTPHAYQLNCRIEFCRSQLRAGHSIADVALAAGFSDQAHFQRELQEVRCGDPRPISGLIS